MLAANRQHRFGRLCLVMALLTLIALPRSAAAEDDDQLRVGVAGSLPFVTPENADGISIEIWRAVADKAGIKYELQQDTRGVPDVLADVHDGKLDVAVGPISITAERSKRVRFTQPYFSSRLSIMSHGESDGGGMWSSVASIVSTSFLVVLGILTLVLILVGTLLWAFERKENPEQFPPHPLRGIGNGMWCAIVTATSVGYGDRVPVTTPGRVVASIWMVIAIFGASSLTAMIASALTVLNLESGELVSPRDLADKKVAAVRGTTGAEFAQRHGARLVEVESLPEAIAIVERGDAEATVFDRPMLQYHLQQNPEAKLSLSPGGFDPQGYGFAVKDAELQRKIDVALLELSEAGTIDNIVTTWIGAQID